MREWTPAQEGANFEFSPILKPLESFRKHLTVLSNLSVLGDFTQSVVLQLQRADTQPPVILSGYSGPALIASCFSATAEWRTDEPSNSVFTLAVASPPDPGNPPAPKTETNGAMVTLHNVTIQNLTPNTTYNYTLTSADEAGAAESTQVVAEWLAEQGYDFWEGDPIVVGGEISIAAEADRPPA